jgi:hypothetical protein
MHLTAFLSYGASKSAACVFLLSLNLPQRRVTAKYGFNPKKITELLQHSYCNCMQQNIPALQIY